MMLRLSPLVAFAVLLVFSCALTSITCVDDSEAAISVNVLNYYLVQNDTDAFLGFRGSMNDTLYYFMSQYASVLFWTELPQYNTSTTQINLDQQVDNFTVNTNANADGNTAFLDTVTNSVWIGGSSALYRAILTGDQATSRTETIHRADTSTFYTSFVDVDRRTGYMISTLGFLWKVTLDKFNASYFSEIPISSPPDVVIYDSTAQIAFFGGEGTLEVYDVGSETSLSVASIGSYSVGAMVYDDVHSVMYACCDGGSNVPEILVYNVSSNYNITFFASLGIGNGELEPGDLCANGVIDKVSGQLFMGFSQSNTGVIAAWDLSTNTLDGFFGFEADPRVVNSPKLESNIVDVVKYPGLRKFYVLGNKQLVEVEYSTTCPSDCSNNGICNFAVCTCDIGYTGLDCGSRTCLNDCSSRTNGQCSDGTCLCNANYTSADCSQRQCPNACSEHGTCGGGPDYICSCTGGWSGSDCTTPPPPAPPPTCPDIADYTTCVGYSYCGWCGDIIHGRCMSGNIVGPVAGACSDWNWDEPPEIGIIILASVILAVVGFMFILDAFSAIRLDLKRGKDLGEEYLTGLTRKPNLTEAAAIWWRDQRAAKAWTTLEHLQFLSVFASLALNYPTRYLYFTRFVYWTNLGLPLPILKDTTFHENRLTGYAASLGLAATKRELLGMEQYANSLGILPKDLYADNMFWVAIVFGGALLLYGFISVIFITKAHWRVVYSCRLTYVILRVISIAYLGMMMTSSYILVDPTRDYHVIVPAGLTILVVGFGYPFGVWLILHGKNKQLFVNEFRFKFGCLYVNYRPENSLFSLRIILRKFVTGIIMGVMAYHLDNEPKYIAIIQAGILGAAQILYGVELARTHPYYDHFHEYLEYFLIVVNLGTIGLSLIHYNAPNEAAYLITALIQVLALVACFGTFIISWMQMHPGFSFKAFFANMCHSDKSEKDLLGTMPMDSVHNSQTGDDTTIGVNQE